MNESVIDRVMPWFAFLLMEKGFAVCVDGELEFVADGHVEMKAPAENFKIRFVIDRGHPFVEIAANEDGGQWFDLGLIRTLITGAEFVQAGKVDELGNFLQASYNQVSETFAESNRQQMLHDLTLLEREQAKKMFPRAFEG